MTDKGSKSEVLEKYFGYRAFREGQEEIIENILHGIDVLGIMPTGAGKSLCYQIPALMTEGVTLVISPLISLMKDQVNALVQSGIGAVYINSTISHSEYVEAVRGLFSGKYKLLYTAPERLSNAGFTDMCRSLNITLIAVDEAHCVSQWGQDFRPSYMAISEFIGKLDKRPVVAAFTATATEMVREDICRILELDHPFVLTTGYDRANLRFSVITADNKKEKLVSLIKERSAVSGIVYCATRSNVENIYDLLINEGISATLYHAGLTDRERLKNQEDFIDDKAIVMVATNAFGMGIDKSNVSYIIHYNMPRDIESYYQEAGRAGRDGEEAECILMYSPADVELHRFMIKNSEPNEMLSYTEQQKVRKHDYERLKHMTRYCTSNDCLRGFILEYFGEKPMSFCGKCSNCLTQYEITDITIEAQKIMSCIVRMKQRFGTSLLTDVLRGSNNRRISELGFNKLSTYGIMKDCSQSRVKQIINALVQKGYIEVSGGEYPVLKLTNRAAPVLRGEVKVTAKMQSNKPKKIAAAKTELSDDENEMLIRLKALRKDLAVKEKVPAYIVFSDAALADMCRKKPKNMQEFSEVAGVGRIKLERYGKDFLREINEKSLTH